ncbi:hypothetical protein C6I20_00515 [Aeromicrobium sp. A1-2]|uniref:DUF5666 domain-containing protein n=1 Tax=Aeromicrobium sp. A1-2 TaxID=2107713 RepID=UPI000E471A5F|nr:DUF5666 domain-containing protein [Aeromicrobium sp. A1-2]AXT83825.1 hypothetical protein C6I20_00515 [Aeromicrobium sp. A1-2]
MRRTIASSVLLCTIGLAAAGCGGSDSTSAAADDQQAAGQGAARGAGQGGSGLVNAVSGSTAQVQGRTSQVAVSWTDSTTFTQQVSAEAADVTVGSCVVVSASESTDAASTDTIAAATVRVTEAVDGSCTVAGGTGGRAGGGQQGAQGEDSADRPTDRPTDRPNGAAGGRAGGGLASGEVTAVSDTGFTVASRQPGSDGAATPVTVTTSSDTKYTATAAAKASDVKVGMCVTSLGETDDTGALTATSIAVADAVDGECAVAGGGRPGQTADQS